MCMRYLFSFLSLFGLLGISHAQNLLKYAGLIGKYPIQMELKTNDGNAFTGSYRYEGKRDWIDLKGSFFASQASQGKTLIL